MTQQEYEQKKAECWEKASRRYGISLMNGTIHAAFNFAFNRAYALGKQEKDAKPNNTIKARRKSDGEIIEVREWRGASDVIYSLPDMNQFYQASDLDFNLDADTVIQGWVARDKNGLLSLFRLYRPERGYDYNGDYGEWGTSIGYQMTIPNRLFPDLTWDSDPIEVGLIIKRKKKNL